MAILNERMNDFGRDFQGQPHLRCLGGSRGAHISSQIQLSVSNSFVLPDVEALRPRLLF